MRALSPGRARSVGARLPTPLDHRCWLCSCFYNNYTLRPRSARGGCIHGWGQCPLLIPPHAGEGFHIIERRASRLPPLVNAPGVGAFTVRGKADLTRRRGEREEFESTASLVTAWKAHCIAPIGECTPGGCITARGNAPFSFPRKRKRRTTGDEGGSRGGSQIAPAVPISKCTPQLQIGRIESNAG